MVELHRILSAVTITDYDEPDCAEPYELMKGFKTVHELADGAFKIGESFIKLYVKDNGLDMFRGANMQNEMRAKSLVNEKVTIKVTISYEVE